MRTLRIIMIVLATMMVAFFIWNLTLTGTYKVSASTQINAPLQDVRGQINNLANWEQWSTFLTRDTTLMITYSTPSAGERAWVTWKHPEGPGGRMEIMKIDSNQTECLITLDGFKGAKSLLTFEAKENSTQLIWEVEGELPFYARFMKAGYENRVVKDLITTSQNLNAHLANGGVIEVEDPLDGESEEEDIRDSTLDSTTQNTVELTQSIVEGPWEALTFYYVEIESTLGKVTWDKCLESYVEVQEYLGEAATNQPMFLMYDVYDEKHDYVMLQVGMIVDVDLPRSSRKVKSSVIRQGLFVEREQFENLGKLHYGDVELDAYLSTHGYQMHGRVFERVLLDENLKPIHRFVRYPVMSNSETVASN
ncbi:MAG: hypothetical protein EP346_07700 [Bacteroidetes bacterium]|uniref:Polyketide cyclase n=1 Tax=Phaeocystidibacter marisrubri TaxID=1577780 RepID=A0A6L3ZKG0_9FLAO|nr:SRPBCC family protein [Phaeocystidibacter marisrubri]KAB2817935.1 hypothetical protein F8C82_05890 [Phaeocystidibacter marisrubri]TNE28868.1 MAG: hypothetical protein EP346_07700 [Bacteroidota bacterium]GGH72792.1 hypothetical protein GCM10011318_17130 [Phaeocystidibacter marisrubri]